MDRKPLRLAILEGERSLAAAGVASPRADAEMLAAHLLGVPRTKLMMVPLVDPEVVESLRELVASRAERVPLQHLIGTAALGAVTLGVGPGVFVPRPETEQLLEWALTAMEHVPDPKVVDLCTGSGALAVAIAHERPDAHIIAVDNSPTALNWARHNARRYGSVGTDRIDVVSGDVSDSNLLADHESTIDLLVCNPPYVPEGTPVPPEVSGHDPHEAVFGGRDGLDVVRHVVASAARLLRPGGRLGIEHDDTHGGSVPALLSARSGMDESRDHADLTGRPRFATARRI